MRYNNIISESTGKVVVILATCKPAYVQKLIWMLL